MRNAYYVTRTTQYGLRSSQPVDNPPFRLIS